MVQFLISTIIGLTGILVGYYLVVKRKVKRAWKNAVEKRECATSG